MKLQSRIALFIARRINRGYWPVIKFAADRDPALQDFRIALSNIPGALIRADLRETVFIPILRHGCMPNQAGHDSFFKRIIRPGDVVYDVGANVGYTMILFASITGRNGKVFAFEPGRRAFMSLTRNGESLANVQVLNLALSDNQGSAVFYEPVMTDISSLIPIEGATKYSVPTATMDRFVEQNVQPDFVKIDVEGHEIMVFKGMVGLLGSERPPIILFESYDKSRLSVCIEEIRNSVKTKHTFFRLQHDGSLLPWGHDSGSDDYLFLPEWASDRNC
jgi:FkbM family methyltransferase